MPTFERNYLIAMFFNVAFCSTMIGLAGFGVIKTKYKAGLPNDFDYRDAALIGIALCFALQSIHYWIQAHAIRFGVEWVQVVRASSTLAPSLLVVYIVNGRITQALNRIYKRCSEWTSKISSLLAR